MSARAVLGFVGFVIGICLIDGVLFVILYKILTREWPWRG